MKFELNEKKLRIYRHCLVSLAFCGFYSIFAHLRCGAPGRAAYVAHAVDKRGLYGGNGFNGLGYCFDIGAQKRLYKRTGRKFDEIQAPAVHDGEARLCDALPQERPWDTVVGA